ncbi:MAG: plastocyanin/azurin family copper-binding protein [Actinomycetota bacterium]
MSTKEDELEAKDEAAADADEPETDQPDTPAAGDGGEPPAVPPPALEAGPALPDPVRDRLLLPLLLPLLAIAAVALYVLNLSRVFLAGGNGAGSVVTGVLVTLAILVGATVISASPRLRSSTLTMTLALMMVLVVSAGLITLGPSEEHGEGEGAGYQQPEGPPASFLEVDALPSLKFQADEFTVAGGILEITYVDKGGSHTLLFDEEEFAGFQLAVPGGPKKGKVEIEEGEYTIYCNIPGHRAAGMEAALIVTPPPPGAGAPPPEGGAPTTTAAP